MRKYTGTVDRLFLFCNVHQVSAGNALAAAWDPDTGGGDTFRNVRLSATGQEPATYYGASTAVDDGMKQGIETAIAQGTPWLTGYQESDGWTFETACLHMNLQILEEI